MPLGNWSARVLGRERLRYVCLLYDGSTRRLTESGFKVKPGIEPVTPGLQDIGLSTTPRRLRQIRENEGFKQYVVGTPTLNFVKIQTVPLI